MAARKSICLFPHFQNCGTIISIREPSGKSKLREELESYEKGDRYMDCVLRHNIRSVSSDSLCGYRTKAIYTYYF